MTNLTFSRDNFWASPLAFLGSLCIHAALAWLIISNMISCGKKGDFGASEVYREAGLYLVEDSPTETEQNEQPVESTTSDVLPVPESIDQALDSLPDLATPLTNLPALPGIGPGPSPSQSSNQTSEMIPKSRPASPTTSGVPGTTEFFDIKTSGQTLLYVIDCSGSMNKHNAFRYAKAEMIASLERLDANHKFQIIFYNDGLFEFTDRHNKPEVHWATAANLSRARAFINGMDNSGGTAHYPAIIKAISYSADVIFFLTDATEPALSAKKLEEVTRRNNGRAAIHCIEFGINPNVNVDNFLRIMARKNEGTYRYRDTSRFDN